jgi:hypothetical protein
MYDGGVACCANYLASQSILPNSPTVTMLLCREQLDLAPKRTIARPSKTPGRATQDIQSSIHPGRANPTVRTSVNRGCPFGDGNGVQAISRHLNLESTLRPRERPKKES